jgi:(4S)-4-hydroxy-5-phosphonooxypentane-2,3-dione isomerase
MDSSQLTEFLVFITVKPGQELAFLRGATANRAGSLKEPGNLRFEMYQSTGSPQDFLFAEKYDSVESVTAHRQSPHFLEFFKILETVQAFPRRREPGNVIPPNFKPVPHT